MNPIDNHKVLRSFASRIAAFCVPFAGAIALFVAAAGPQIHAASTPTFNSKATVKLVPADETSAVNGPRPETPSDSLAPYPPDTEGCFHLVNGNWESVPCATEEEIKEHGTPPPILANSIQSTPHPDPLQALGKPPTEITLPFVWGSVTIDLTSKPADGTEKSGSTDNAFSIQTNTNTFPCSKCKDNSPFAPNPKVANSASKKGDKGWVQFVYQQFHTGASAGKGNTNLCVWNVDVTVANNTANLAGYAATCVYPSKTEAVAPLEGKDAPTGAAEVIGYVKCPKENSDDDCKLWVVAKLPWSPGSGWWSVSAPDSMGLAGKWTNVSGTMLGPGGGAQADFTKTQIKNVLRAYDCYKSPASKSKTTPVACPGPPAWDREGRAFDLTATPANYFPTGESNNLTNGPVKFTCGTGDCWLTYSSGIPKS